MKNRKNLTAKRPSIDLMALTSDQAMPMPEAVQRTAMTQTPQPVSTEPVIQSPSVKAVPSADLQPLAFKVPPAFRKRFRQRAVEADLKLNELLFAAFEAYEEKHGHKK